MFYVNQGHKGQFKNEIKNIEAQISEILRMSTESVLIKKGVAVIVWP